MKNYLILSGLLIATWAFFAFTAPMAKRKVMADKTQSTVTYAAKHPLHSWEGVSKEVNGAMMYNDETKQPESVAVSIKVSSFDSDNNNRDSHAMEVLDGIKFPNVTFTSSNIKTAEDGTMSAQGTLTFHGVPKPVTLQATRKEAGGKMTLTGQFPVNMTDYGIERPSLMGMKVEDGMVLRFNLVFNL
ncbi:YceI family protein [Spirosoma flavus]